MDPEPVDEHGEDDAEIRGGDHLDDALDESYFE